MEAFFIESPRGPLFSVYHPATCRGGSPLGLIYVPPFAEEMNRARRMVALQARLLAEVGVDVLLLDPFGTGDSAGDFGDATWEIWREDVKAAMAWLSERIGGKVGLWGLRLGALLAADVAAADAGSIARLVLWQPVLSGERHLTQFLRLRLAASMGMGLERDSIKGLRRRLSDGESLEVAGYELAPSLANAMASLGLQSLIEKQGTLRVDWLEVVSGDQPSLAAGSQQIVDALKQRGLPLAAEAVSGEPFWAIQEITLAPNLLRATTDVLRA